MIGLSEVCRHYLLSVTKHDSIPTPAKLSTARLRCARTLEITGNIVFIGNTNILEAQLTEIRDVLNVYAEMDGSVLKRNAMDFLSQTESFSSPVNRFGRPEVFLIRTSRARSI